MEQPTKIITTIGPASESVEMLQYFIDHSVEYARLNFSHGSVEWHLQAAEKCRAAGLSIMLDTAGPKILLGELRHSMNLSSQSQIAFEYQNNEQIYPYAIHHQGREIMVFPCQFAIETFVKPGMSMYIDDGKIHIEVMSIENTRAITKVHNGGIIKSNKGVNIPGSAPDIDFLVDRDRELLQALLPVVRPEYVALSYVRSSQDISVFREYIDQFFDATENYRPKICTKVELAEAVEPSTFINILDSSDMIMVARGDMALEVEPIHIAVPFYQDALVQICKTHNTPCIIATQMLESMTESPVPTRAEVSDIYRAVVTNQAEYIMLSGETAAGKYPREAVKIMHDVISSAGGLQTKLNSLVATR